MIDTKKFLNLLLKKDIKYFCGVPDSCTNKFCDELNLNKKTINTVTANEGSAVSLGIGYHLSKKKLPCIYLQNSGLGNATDPLTNLSNKEVYKIPMLLLIGWRGAPGIKDEAQHDIQGRILKDTLNSFSIKYLEIKNEKDFPKISKLIKYANTKSRCIALLIKPKIFQNNIKKRLIKKVKSEISRKDLVLALLKNIKKKTNIISSVGYNSRELYQLRKEYKFKNGKDFLLVGGMGHTSMVSLGVSQNTKSETVCIDGDGSFIMHLGALTILGNEKRKNFKYILVDNESHESIGNQTINLKNINFRKLSESLGFKKYFFTYKKKELEKNIKNILKANGPSFLHIKIKTGTLKNLVRPKNFYQIKKNFMRK
tara:strand:- start:2862 stop:3968 length:1107 start_codon:yes stop_codon:yes gene_type:complete